MLTAYSGRYSNTVGYAYDAAGRKKTESLTIAGQTYTTTTEYNARGQLTKYTYPDSTVVDRSYTARGELYQLKHAGATIDTRVYDNGGRMISSIYNNGVVDTRAYGSDNTLSSITFTGSGTSIGNLSYGWDNNHNKTSETITGTMSNYGFSIPTDGYDGEDRLVSFNRTSGLSQSWNLSAVGDWNSVTTNGTAQTRTHGPTHELLTGAGSNVSTDLKGNITLIPSSLRPNASSVTSTWDFDNRLASATTGSTTVSHQYDALGRRVARTSGSSTTVYVQAGQQTIADYASGAVPASSTYRYLYASYIDEPVMRWTTSSSTPVYYHRNQQYSVTALTDSSGAVLERYAYTAYGVPTIANASGGVLSSSALNNRYTYTGREWDYDIQQYHFRARMYDPGLGRFCSRDPIGFFGGINAFAVHHTLQGCDPLGLKPWIVGPEAAAVSFIAPFKPTAELAQEVFDEANKATGNQLQPGDLHVIMIFLTELARSANPSPAATYATWDTLLKSQEYRGFGRLQVEISCNCGYFIEDMNTPHFHDQGWTPFRLPNGYTVKYDQGEGEGSLDVTFADDISSPVWTNNSKNAFCVRAVLKNQFRIGFLGQLIAKIAFNTGVPFVWADIEYRMCCDSTYSIEWSGSNFPTHWAYLDKSKVGGRPQKDLAAFTFRTPNARAAGGVFHAISGSGVWVDK